MIQEGSIHEQCKVKTCDSVILSTSRLLNSTFTHLVKAFEALLEGLDLLHIEPGCLDHEYEFLVVSLLSHGLESTERSYRSMILNEILPGIVYIFLQLKLIVLIFEEF